MITLSRPVRLFIALIVLSILLSVINFSPRFPLRLGLDLAGGTRITLEADMGEVPQEDRSFALDSVREIIERRVNLFGVSEPVVQTARSPSHSRIIVELPGITDANTALSLIGKTARLEFREFLDVGMATVGATLQNTKPTTLTGADFRRARVEFSPETGEPVVAIEFTQEGAVKFADLTTRLVGFPLAIFLDETALAWPIVQTPITGGQGVISGGFTKEGAKTLALQLTAGSLPVPVSPIEERTIGATLGASSVEKSVRAGIVGLALVTLFMIFQYGRLGVYAVMALVVYGLVTLALFRLIPITLTLPGIAGFILSIGMAVDSNILIFERFAEEKRKGKPWHIAMEQAFGKAWDSIRDANLTTILTSLILFNPGNWQFLPSSGLVRGFALTLLLGVLTSLFTGIVATRTFIRVLYKEKT